MLRATSLCAIITTGVFQTAAADLIQPSTATFTALQGVYSKVDVALGAGRQELSKLRLRNTAFDTELSGTQSSHFGDQLTVELVRHLKSGLVKFSGFRSIFSIPGTGTAHPLSLSSHSVCQTSSTDLRSILRDNTDMRDREFELVNTFEKAVNKRRREYLADPNKQDAFLKTWAALAGCLAYAESIGDADGTSSVNRARELLGAGYQKPPGVKFYYDSTHSNEESRWNVGLYQFVLKRGGNINSCLQSWKAHMLPGSTVVGGLNLKGMGKFVGSPSQSFNAFCGVNKILQSFYVQAYTTNRRYTHPNNRGSASRLKPPSDRCVSLHHGKAYSHFGPLTRSVVNRSASATYRSNLEKVMQCTVSAIGK